MNPYSIGFLLLHLLYDTQEEEYIIEMYLGFLNCRLNCRRVYPQQTHFLTGLKADRQMRQMQPVTLQLTFVQTGDQHSQISPNRELKLLG